MEKTVEKIKEIEAEASKLVAQAEAEGRNLLISKKDEVENNRREFEKEMKELIVKAQAFGEQDAQQEIVTMEQEIQTKMAELEKKFDSTKEELIGLVIKEL